MEDCDMTLRVSASSPTDILTHLENHPGTSGLYFLDVDLQHQINGIDLASRIRNMDSSATIVFITTHEEMVHLVFTHKIEAMDYIVKGITSDFEKRVVECMKVAYKRYLDGKGFGEKIFTIKVGDQIINVPYSEILYFETHLSVRHKIILHMYNDRIEFRSLISKIAKSDPDLFQCYQSYVVNLKKIRRLDRGKKEIELVNGQTIPVAARKIPELLRRIG